MPKTMNDSDPPEQNKRVGLHPMIVIFGVIIGFWLFIQAIIPKSKDIHPPQGNEVRSEQLALLLKEAESAPVPSIKVTAHVQGMNALSPARSSTNHRQPSRGLTQSPKTVTKGWLSRFTDSCDHAGEQPG